MQGCVSEDTTVFLKDKTGEVLEVTFAFFNALLDADPSGADLGEYRILSRSGWTELLSVARRNLWEGEQLCHSGFNVPSTDRLASGLERVQ